MLTWIDPTYRFGLKQVLESISRRFVPILFALHLPVLVFSLAESMCTLERLYRKPISEIQLSSPIDVILQMAEADPLCSLK